MKHFKIGFFITFGDEKPCNYHCISECGKFKRHKWKLIKRYDETPCSKDNVFQCVQCRKISWLND